MKGKMSRWGTGPTFAVLSISYGTVTIQLSRYFYPVFYMGFAPHWFLTILGIALIVMGIPFYIISATTVMFAYNTDNLVTDGIYRCCRHPLYASWMFFIAPGIALLVNSWIVLTTPIFMYLILRKLVKKEEIYLESVFSSKYSEYKKKVPCIMPFGWIKPII
ncbi:MAG TPA: isoprenylcysteine carboxylmethyltransferase family protein [Smithella sp.]|nr:isoprenylcysteine carboxylmethyltransferase family protein [Smithella sp.]